VRDGVADGVGVVVTDAMALNVGEGVGATVATGAHALATISERRNLPTELPYRRWPRRR